MVVRFLILVFLLTFSLSFLFISLHGRESYLRIDVLDVGQGDAILITTPSGVQMLVDAGRDTSVLRALGQVMGLSDRHIDVVVATHPDADHIGGFSDVLDRFDVESVVGVNAYNDTGIFQDFIQDIGAEGAYTYEAQRGQIINLGSGVFAQVLFPYKGTTITGNDASVVLQIMYGDTEILLTGDVGTGVEEHLIFREGELLESDVLKVGHHGSKTSTSKMFLETVKPIVSLISAGADNRYRHPHEEVLQTLASVGVQTLGTYEEGTITLLSDGKNVWRK